MVPLPESMASSPPPNLKFITIRPSDVEPPRDIPISADEWRSHRIETLREADNWLSSGFDARHTLVDAIVEIGGIDAFKERWEALAERGGGRAAAVMARAAEHTSRGLEALGLTDLMTCAYEFGDPPEKKKLKWPVLGIAFPELSPWHLTPDSKTSEELFVILERECPELMSGNNQVDSTTKDEESWKLFLEHSRLCETPDSPGHDMSLQLQVRDTKMSANMLRNGATRLYALGEFLSQLVIYSTDYCVVCKKSGSELKRCKRCHSALYCGRECQIKDFNDGHKRACKNLRTLQERYSNVNPIPDKDVLGAFIALESFLYPLLRDTVISSVKEKVKDAVREKHPEMDKVQKTETVNEDELVNFM